MQVEWYGQSAFRLTDGATTVVLDPFDDLGPLTARGLRWEYPAIAGVEADLVLVTHEHLDHNGVGAIGGDPAILRSTAGRLDSAIGEVLAVAAEHDDAFAQRAARVERLRASVFELDDLPDGDGPLVVVPAAP
jgi:hypothetical protein